MPPPQRFGKAMNIRSNPSSTFTASFQHDDLIESRRLAAIERLNAAPHHPLYVPGRENFALPLRPRKDEVQAHAVGSMVGGAPAPVVVHGRKKMKTTAEGTFIGFTTIASGRRHHAVPPLANAPQTPRM